jgi:hypothetical protein
MGIDTSEMLTRRLRNKRSIGRKIVAAIAHRIYGIPIIKVAHYFNSANSSVSRMLEQGEAYAKEYAIVLKH